MAELTRAQERMLTAARAQGWIRPTGANDLRTANALINRGLLEVHPDYSGSVFRPVER